MFDGDISYEHPLKAQGGIGIPQTAIMLRILELVMRFRFMQVAESPSARETTMASSRASPFAGDLEKPASARNGCVPREQARLCAF